MDEAIMIGLSAVLDPWRMTKLGANEWTDEALRNLVNHLAYYRDTINTLHGTLTSGYRSKEINAMLPGASKTSRHCDALAIDVASLTYSPVQGAREVWRKAGMGMLGDVQEVIAEPSWVHVGWLRPGERKAPRLLKATASGYQPLAP
jgi:uncharacterized protein YcbK (DUF882 family)